MSRPTLSHIIWDWNGTLLDDLALSHQLTLEQLRANGIAPISIEEYRELFTHPVSLFYYRLGFHLSPLDFPRLSHEFHLEYARRRHGVKLHKGATESLRLFRQYGLVQIILSAHEQSLLDGSLELFGLRGLLDQAWGMRDTIGHSKFENGKALLSTLGIPRNQVLLVGDTDHDAEVADKLGLHCALINQGYQDRSILTRTRKPILSSLFDLQDWIMEGFQLPALPLQAARGSPGC
ncbi:MAG: HAD hydrolase-like protein [Bdellovibrionota bacterium]|nr:MAG: HAD hydrolase-like protein [Bdellovibrionota bacterium]